MELDLKAKFGQFFGIVPEFEPEVASLLPTKVFGTAASAPLFATDYRGVQYYMPVRFTYTEPNNAEPQVVDLSHPVISPSASKTIISTPLTERRGTVKELVSLDEVKFTIRGIIIGEANELPEAQMQVLWNLFAQNRAMKMMCALSDMMLVQADNAGSDMVVIKSLSFPEVKGVMHVRPYEMEVVSDSPFSLKVVRK